MLVPFLLALAQTPVPTTANAAILTEIRQDSKEGKFDAILPLVERLGSLDEADAEKADGLVNGTLVGQLEPKDRPLMLRVVRAMLTKAPFDDPKENAHWQTKGTEARLLEVLNRHDEAMATLDDTMAKTSEIGRNVLGRMRDHLALVGKPAPPVAFTKNLGRFPGLAKWHGKVVVIDFFAHWCGPCIAEFPDMKAVYRDDHAKGLEIVGATEFYGYLGARKGLAPDEEFAGMKGFVKDQGLPWPVVFTGPKTKDEYRQLGLPNVVVVDRRGVVREVGYGFYPGEPGKLRSLVERLLAER